MGGGNCLFGIETPIPLFRGNMSVVEVASANTNPTKLPDTGVLQSGTMETAARCFDLLCFGKFDSTSAEPKLNVKPADKIPNLITKNKDGMIVFAEPSYMCTIQAPKGQNVWVNIKLESKNGQLSSDYMCLGIKKRGEDEHFDILYTNNSARYIDVLETDVVELIPLVSSTKLPTYTAVKAGEEIKLDGIVPTDLDFGSVYRVQITLSSDRWLIEQKVSVNFSDRWDNIGQMGIGPVVDSTGKVYDNALVSIDRSGNLFRSFDGGSWINVGNTGLGTQVSPVYGNGIWCATGNGIVRSTDNGRTWAKTFSVTEGHNLHFANGIFMTITNSGIVYSSSDAECWTQIGKINMSATFFTLIFGDGKWICGAEHGYLFWSKDGKGNWEELQNDLPKGSNRWFGGCYANGYFYVIRDNGLIMRSQDGREWREILDLSSRCYHNVTYHKNKLYVFNHDSSPTTCSVALFSPDGTL